METIGRQKAISRCQLAAQLIQWQEELKRSHREVANRFANLAAVLLSPIKLTLWPDATRHRSQQSVIERLTKFMLRGRFEKARKAAGLVAQNFQFRDLRAKAASDLRDQVGLEAAQTLLGHSSVTMTEHYTRNRQGKIAEVIPKGRWNNSDLHTLK